MRQKKEKEKKNMQLFYSNIENNNEIYSLAQYEAKQQQKTEINNINEPNEQKQTEQEIVEEIDDSIEIEERKPQQEQLCNTAKIPTSCSNHNNKHEKDNSNKTVVVVKVETILPNNNLNNSNSNNIISDDIKTKTPIDNKNIVNIIKCEKAALTAATFPIDDFEEKSTLFTKSNQNSSKNDVCKTSSNIISNQFATAKPPQLVNKFLPDSDTFLKSLSTELQTAAKRATDKRPKSVTASVFRSAPVDTNNISSSNTNLLKRNVSTTIIAKSAIPKAIIINSAQLQIAPRAQSVTASVFTPISQLGNKISVTATVKSTATNKQQQQQQQQQELAQQSRPEDMNKGFLSFDDECELTMLKEEPDDLAHLASNAVDGCMPLDETTPLFSEMLVGLMPYSSLLTDDINSLDSNASSSASSCGVRIANGAPNMSSYSSDGGSSTCSSSSPALSTTASKAVNKSSATAANGTGNSNVGEKNVAFIDPFINYREESNDTNYSPHLLSPSIMSKSPEGSSLPSLCSPNSLSQEDEFAFMTMNVDDDIDLTMRAPYIPMNEQDDLPLLTADDLMWCNGATFSIEDLQTGKDCDVLSVDTSKLQLQMQQQQQNMQQQPQFFNNRNLLLNYQQQQQQPEQQQNLSQQQHYNNSSLCNSPATSISCMSPATATDNAVQQQDFNSTDASSLTALLCGNATAGANETLALLNSCVDDIAKDSGNNESLQSTLQKLQQIQQQQKYKQATDYKLEQQSQLLNINCKKARYEDMEENDEEITRDLCDSIENALEQVYSKNANLNWDDLLQMDSNDEAATTNNETSALTPTTTAATTNIQMIMPSNNSNNNENNNKQPPQIQPGWQQNVIINTVTNTLHVPLLSLQDNTSKNMLQSQTQALQHPQQLTTATKLLLNDELLNTSNPGNKKMSSIKLLNINANNNNNNNNSNNININNNATTAIRIVDNRMVGNKVVTKKMLQQQGNKRHLPPTNAVATPQNDAKRSKNTAIAGMAVTQTHLLQHLIAPLQQQQKAKEAKPHVAEAEQQQRKVLAQRWSNINSNSLNMTAQESNNKLLLSAKQAQQLQTQKQQQQQQQEQQQSNSVLKNLLVSGCDVSAGYCITMPVPRKKLGKI